MNNKLPEAFIAFLDSLTFKAENEYAQVTELWAERPSVKASGERFFKPAVRLHQKSPTQMSLTGFRQKILQLLREANHVASEPVADAVLGCIIGAASTGAERAKCLEDALARFHKAEVSHYFVLPNSAIAKPVNFEGYRLGEIDLAVLTSRSNRARSDFAQLYGQELKGRFTLQSPCFRHVVIDFLKLGYDSGLFAESQVWRGLLLNYFERISRQHFEYMWDHLERTQVLCAPFGADFLDVQNIKGDLGKFANRITIYLECSRVPGGYVVPEVGGVTLNQPGPDSESFSRYLAHCKMYHLAEIGDSELGRASLVCANFCQQAKRFLENQRPDDAALYATICLENLFSEKNATSEAICTRTAALAFLRLAPNFSEAERELRKLYDARSSFVHSGKSIHPSQAERLVAYARETLRSLLVLHLTPANRNSGFLIKWIKNLDFIIAGMEAGRTFEPAFLAENGIFGA